MARIRTIKPEFFTSLTIGDLTPEQRLTFIGLWTHIDDEGRCVDDPRLIKAALWPLDERTAEDVGRDLVALQDSSLIVRYQVGGKPILAVTGWQEHQKIPKPTPSKLPAPDQADDPDPDPVSSENCDSGRGTGELPEDYRSPTVRNREQGPGNRDQGTGNVGAGNRDREAASPPPVSSESAARTSDTAPPRADVERICNHLATRIEDNGSPRPTVSKRWRDAARLLLDRDGRTEEQVHSCIDWCQDSDFWRANVLSMPKLREKYDTLRLQAQRETAPAGTVVDLRSRQQRETDAQFEAAYARAQAREAAQDAARGAHDHDREGRDVWPAAAGARYIRGELA